jgi:XTP/dITP diphosphohydrolase
MLPSLILATGNRHKVVELRELLAGCGWQLDSLPNDDHLPEIDEAGATLAENARTKSIGYARYLGQWTLGDDTGLFVDALEGAPGVRAARFAGPKATAEANRARLLEALENVPLAERAARFACHLALADPHGNVRAEATGACRGRIRVEPAGDLTFGYDPLFEVVEYHRTFAELGPTKQWLSHRARACRTLAPRLRELAIHCTLATSEHITANHGLGV